MKTSSKNHSVEGESKKTSFTSVFVRSALVDYLFASCSTILMKITQIEKFRRLKVFYSVWLLPFVLNLNEKDGENL